jgi:hypothetical protein
VLPALALALCWSGSLRGQQVDAEKLARVKAGFVVNFVRYTTWPAATFAGPGSPFTITVIGSDPVADLLEDIAARSGDVAGGRGLVVERAEVPPDPDPDEREAVLERLRRSHVVYVGWPDGAAAMGLLSALGAYDVLTVGDGPGFAAAGGMIGLRRDGERVVFDANPDVIRATGLSVSSRVLRLATLVASGGGR